MFFPIFFKHPLTKSKPFGGIGRYFKWHIFRLLNRSRLTHQLIGKTKIYLGKNDTAALVNYYTGLYEFEEMCFLLHFLRREDFLIDVGANIGVFSLLGSGHVGCNSIAFEPIPDTFKTLQENIELNGLQAKIKLLNMGLGSRNTSLHFIKTTENSLNRVAVGGEENTIEVNVDKLDNVLPGIDTYGSTLLKIDVEGFETEVLNGATSLLKNPLLKAIIIELNGSGSKYGFDEEVAKKKINDCGFTGFTYDPFSRSFSSDTSVGIWGNVIYIRDVEFVKKRVASASPIKILNTSI